MKIEVADALLRELKQLNSPTRKLIGTAINLAAEAWGYPHRHAGAGIRRLTRDYFECRSGLRRRLVFQAFPDKLYFAFIGNHDEVQRFIKSIR